MAQWADFGVFRVKYGSSKTAIVEVEVKPDNGDSFGAAQRKSRSQVVTDLAQGVTYVTVPIRDGKATKGDNVGTVTVDGVKYLRTDGNKVKADNLGSLPEYD